MFCPQCRSQEIINKNITPIYECYDCGYMFNDENFILSEKNVENHPKKMQSISVSELIFDKNDFIGSIILIFIVIFPFILTLLM